MGIRQRAVRRGNVYVFLLECWAVFVDSLDDSQNSQCYAKSIVGSIVCSFSCAYPRKILFSNGCRSPPFPRSAQAPSMTKANFSSTRLHAPEADPSTGIIQAWLKLFCMRIHLSLEAPSGENRLTQIRAPATRLGGSATRRVESTNRRVAHL